MKKSIVVALMLISTLCFSSCSSNKDLDTVDDFTEISGASSDIIKKAKENKGYPENRKNSPAPSCDDWRAFRFTLDGKEYSLWQFKMDDLDPSYQLLSNLDAEEVKKNVVPYGYRNELDYHSSECTEGYDITISYYNNSENKQPLFLEDCLAMGLTFAPPWTADWTHVMDSSAVVPDIVLSKGITIGSTVADVIDAYGDASLISNGDGQVFVYMIDQLNWMALPIKNDHVYGIRLVCENPEVVEAFSNTVEE